MRKMKHVHFLQDGWGGSSQPWDDVEDNCAPGWPSPSDKEDEELE